MKPTTQEIQELIRETIEELSQLIEARHSEHMVEIDRDSQRAIPMTDRIVERYTLFHKAYFTETADITDIGA